MLKITNQLDKPSMESFLNIEVNINNVDYKFTRQTIYARLLKHRGVYKDPILILSGHKRGIHDTKPNTIRSSMGVLSFQCRFEILIYESNSGIFYVDNIF